MRKSSKKHSQFVIKCKQNISGVSLQLAVNEIWIFGQNEAQKNETRLPDATLLESYAKQTEKFMQNALAKMKTKMLLSLFSHQFFELVLKLWTFGKEEEQKTETT